MQPGRASLCKNEFRMAETVIAHERSVSYGHLVSHPPERSWLSAGRAAAVWLTIDVDGESAVLAEGRRFAQQPMVMSHQAYGPEVGVPRLLELLREYGLPATFFVPGMTARCHPGAVEAILEAGHEVGHHGHSHRLPVRMSEDEELEDLEAGLEALRALGAQPRGFRAPRSCASFRTARLIAGLGLHYDSSLMDDDRPYVIRTEAGDVAELPPYVGLDDLPQYAYLPAPDIGQRIKSPERVLPMWHRELEGARRFGCLFTLTLHPFVSGRPSRLEALRSLIELALSEPDVEFAGGDELAERTLADESLPRRSLDALDLNPDPAVYPNP